MPLDVKSFLKCILVNCRSIVNKIDELPLLYNSFDMIFITESWLKDSIPNSLVLQNYDFQIIRCDRKKTGGGVCCIFRNNLSVIVDKQVNNPAFEILSFSLLQRKQRFKFILTYLAPSSNTEDMTIFVEKIQECISKKDTCVLLGDFNAPEINWNLHSNNNISEKSRLFLDFTLNNGLTQLVTFPTRQNNTLDLILTDRVDNLSNIQAQPPFGNSDHESICFQIQHSTESQNINIEHLDFKKANFADMNVYFAQILQDDYFSSCITVDDMWEKFTTCITHAIDIFVPKVKIRSKSRKHYPKNIIDLQKKKLKIWRQLKTGENKTLREKYKQKCQQIKTEIKKFHERTEQKIVDTKNQSCFFAYIKKQNNSNHHFSPLKINNVTIHSNKEKSAAFNDYFSSVYIPDNNIMPVFSSRTEKSLENVKITAYMVYNILSHLKPSLSSGPDNIPNVLLKNCCVSLAEPLRKIFEISLQTNTLPKDWLTAIVCPIYKKGVVDDVQNYRPISLTCTCCRVFERIICNTIIEFLQNNKLLHPEQHGFVRKKSTTTNLVQSFHDWTIGLENRKNTDIVYIDFSKAFDTVCHTKLLTKLRAYGVKGNLSKWIYAFLNNRSQRVRLSTDLSNSNSVMSGVPQGSVLGPLLFLIYINDLIDLKQNSINIQLFADDLKVYTNVTDNSDKIRLQTFLTLINDWTETWQLKISVEKCYILHIGKKNPNFEYTLSSSNIPVKNECKDLGVVISDDLTFEKHISQIRTKCLQRIYLLFKYFRSKNQYLLTCAFKSFVRPILEFNSVVWNPHLYKHIDQLESVQRNFTKRVFKFQSISYSERLKRLNIQSLEERRIHADLIFCYKIMNNFVDIQRDVFFNIATTRTRGHNFKIHKRLAKLDKFKFSFANRIVDNWNSLSHSTVNLPTVEAFKSALKLCKFNVKGHALE
jgi:hypothetical protein